MSKVKILNEQAKTEIPVEAVRRMTEKLLAHLGLGGKELSIVFADDKAIRALNRRFLDRDRPTNVLAMSQTESGEPDVPGFENRLLGDVMVSVETCARDAKEAGVDPLEEVVFCLVHGIAHLAGYDHEGENAVREKEMQEFEMDLFRRFGPMVLSGQT